MFCDRWSESTVLKRKITKTPKIQIRWDIYQAISLARSLSLSRSHNVMIDKICFHRCCFFPLRGMHAHAKEKCSARVGNGKNIREMSQCNINYIVTHERYINVDVHSHSPGYLVHEDDNGDDETSKRHKKKKHILKEEKSYRFPTLISYLLFRFIFAFFFHTIIQSHTHSSIRRLQL